MAVWHPIKELSPSSPRKDKSCTCITFLLANCAHSLSYHCNTKRWLTVLKLHDVSERHKKIVRFAEFSEITISLKIKCCFSPPFHHYIRLCTHRWVWKPRHSETSVLYLDLCVTIRGWPDAFLYGIHTTNQNISTTGFFLILFIANRHGCCLKKQT